MGWEQCLKEAIAFGRIFQRLLGGDACRQTKSESPLYQKAKLICSLHGLHRPSTINHHNGNGTERHCRAVTLEPVGCTLPNCSRGFTNFPLIVVGTGTMLSTAAVHLEEKRPSSLQKRIKEGYSLKTSQLDVSTRTRKRFSASLADLEFIARPKPRNRPA